MTDSLDSPDRVLSVSTAAYDGHPTAVALADLAALGVRHVELAYIQGYLAFDEDSFSDSSAAQVARMLDAEGLRCLAVSAHVDAGTDEAVDQLQRRLAFARRIGARIVITNATTRDRKALFLANIERLASIAADLDVTIALENPGHGAGNLIGGAADAVALMREIGSERVRINYDFGNVFTYSHEMVRPEADFEAALPWAVHFHMKDVRSGPQGWAFVPIGDGSVDYAAILRCLAASGDATPIGLELPLRLVRPNRSDPQRGAEPLELDAIRRAVARSLAYVRERLFEPAAERPRPAAPL
jgi:sugar phosphate isomerase/epimerase